MGTIAEDLNEELLDLTSIGILETTKPGYYKLGPLHYELIKKKKDNIPLTQEERNKVLSIGMSIEEVMNTLEVL